MPDTDERELFREVQPLHQNLIARAALPLVTVITGAILLPQAFGPAQQNRGELLLMFLLCGIVLPGWLLALRLVTIVTDRRLVIRFSFMPGRDIDVRSITRADPLKYNPIRDAGGWGWRMSLKYHRVFNISGNRGVHVRYGDSKREQFLVGSRRSDELAEAIELARFDSEI